ncbi:MAG: 2,3-bisphosphoglycerate-independent phosphoglycerate mutase, partial [Gemmatimonadales bacterium]
MSNRGGPVVLIVLDGWGYRPQRDGNAIELGDTPTWHQIWQRAPHTLLQASGEAVGLPHGQMGNSEVGHLNLGAGRIVSQDIVRITDSIVSGEFYHNKSLRALADGVTASRGTLHLVGLIGPGGVHAHEAHWDGLMELARRSGVPRVALHAFLDGRDTPPTSAADYVRALVNSA